MLNKSKLHNKKAYLWAFCLLLILALAACGTGGDSSADGHNDDGHSHSGDTHSDDETSVKVPNNGATIEIISPASGDTFAQGVDIVIEVNVENFELGTDGNHWHVKTPASTTMVMGANTDEVLRNLPAGEHMIEVALSNGDHAELEDGDMIMITVEE